MRARCALCPRRCVLEEGETGFCRARKNRGGAVISSGYGHVTALSTDPIEKKPLRRFFPGSRIFSMGGFGCNPRCPFCQNHAVSMAGDETPCAVMQPEELVEQARLCCGIRGISALHIPVTSRSPGMNLYGTAPKWRGGPG